MLGEYANSTRQKHTIQLLSIATLHKWRWTVGTRQQTLFTTEIRKSNSWTATHFHHAARTKKNFLSLKNYVIYFAIMDF